MMSRARLTITFGIWGLCALGSLYFWSENTPDRGSIPAVVEASRHALGPSVSGRVGAVFVRPGDLVHAGAAVVQLSSEALDAELEVAHRVYDEVLAELDAVTAAAQQEVRSQRQSLTGELARTRASLAAARGEEAGARAEISSLREQLGRLDGVVQDRLAQADRVGGLRARQEALAESARHAPELLSAWSGLANEVNRALAGITDEAVAAKVRPLRARLETQSARVTNLLEARARLTLRAPVDAQVTLVLRSSGDAVAAGQTVVQLVARQPTRVVAYAPEEIARAFLPGRAVVARPRERGVHAAGTVSSLGSEIVEMPAHLWTAPNRPRFGRPVYIELSNAQNDGVLISGESVNVAMLSGGGGAEAAVHQSSAPPILPVPDVLRARTRLEGSGLVFIAEWGRFLAISDDTGLKGVDIAPPWVFTFDPVQGFDPEPIVIEGLETMSDFESVARASDGTVFLLCSQSLSQKGRRPEKRQLLVRARVQASPPGLKVIERVALHDTLAAGIGSDDRQELGWTALLDIEGMAFADGGLILGLKAPLDQAGRARLLKLKLGSGEKMFEGLGVETYRHLSLSTCTAKAPGGVSDLYADGTTLYLTSTLPEGPPCGSAWRLDLHRPEASPVRIEDFEGFKPEGISRDAAGHLLVLFDTDEAAPRLAALPEPKP